MSLIVYIIVLAITGLVVGALARLALPGRDPMSLFQTMLVGLAGSFAAGLISLAIFHGRSGGGILLSVICSAVIVYFIRRSRGGSLMSPGDPGRRGGGVFGR
jgi:uncharacterized membrane protein YeaQ/YmgE (transglycosylase-associated protein family)